MFATQGRESLGTRNEAYLAHFELKLSGQVAPEEVHADLLDFSVENSLHLPDMCMVRMHDQHFNWLDDPRFQEGKEIEVRATHERGTLEKIFHGEIVGVELDLAGHGNPLLSIRCLARSHRLHRGRHSRSYVQVTDSDIFNKIAQEEGFT